MTDIERGTADGGGSVQTVGKAACCAWCGKPLTEGPRQRFCDDACRSRRHRGKKAAVEERIIQGLKDQIAELQDELVRATEERS